MENSAEFKLDIQKYLERINYTGPLDGGVKELFALQEAHYIAVPYENFDILAGRPLSLSIPDLYKKIVLERRGGYCFELNGLFAELLRQLGYEVTEYFSRYLRDEPPLPMPRHRVMVAEAQGKRYFVDIGVGGVVPRWPLLMAPGVEQKQNNELYRLSRDEVLGNVIQEFRHGQWSNYISFTDEPAYPVDFIAANYWCQYAPESIFNKEPMAAILTPNGRVTMFGPEVRVFSPDGVKVIPVGSEDEVKMMAKEWFGVNI
jgi:arylamine N-acetyltransferase